MIEHDVTAGTEYTVVVDGFGGLAHGAYVLDIELCDPVEDSDADTDVDADTNGDSAASKSDGCNCATANPVTTLSLGLGLVLLGGLRRTRG